MSTVKEAVKYDEAVFAEMIVYIAEKMEDDPSFGATKLNKVLFFSDFIAYLQDGDAISGADYQKLPNGPAPRRLLPVLRELESRGVTSQITRDYLGKKQKRTIALRDADRDMFKASDLKVIDQVMEALRGRSATNVSDLSHRLSVGWQLADQRESIPYNTVFISDPSDADIERGKELAREHGWATA